ncbi:MAG TPA: alpha/beta fold hydrolase [Candidatus Binataceae bacterium]|nr:alpha/beta fold hydrolase [Candidatus Binataceae bacterium]
MTSWKTDRIPGTPRIAIDHAGSGSLVVLMHGIGGNRSNWHDQLPEFAGYFHAVTWDARGYGDSDDYEGALNFGDFASDLARLLDHFKAPRAHLVGLSMGGVIALDFVSRWPDRVATLTLCDSLPGFSHISDEQRAEFIRLRQEPLLAGIELKDMAPAVAKSLLGKSPRPGSFERLVASMSALHKDSYLKTIAGLANYTRVLNLEAISVPTHIVVGAEDSLTPPAISREMARRIAGARLTIIEDAGHLSNIEQPETFNRAVLGFLKEHREETDLKS